MLVHNPVALLKSLCALPRETGWVEFKENNFNCDSVGQYVSALANSAMLEKKEAAYLVFGVRDDTHEIVGTSVDLLGEHVGTDAFMFWLTKYLEPRITVQVEQLEYDGKRVEILCIAPGYQQPVKFKRIPYIRIGSSQQPLSNYADRERELWQITSGFSFETSTLDEHFSSAELSEAFSIKALLSKIGGRSDDVPEALEDLAARGLIKDDMQGKFAVSTLLAISCGRDARRFPLFEGKTVRVIAYKGKDKLTALDDHEGRRGYLTTFSALLDYIMGRLPSVEQMLHGVRTKVYGLPERSIREFLANAIVHQDFTQPGRPLVEIFKDKVRITNPGIPLVSVDRFIATPSKTRNPKFAKMMRDAGLCEERGSGVDRAIDEIERASLPPPLIEEVEGATVVTMFMARKFADMSAEERQRACFQHACLAFERSEPMSNSSLRSRFGLSARQYTTVSNIIADTIASGRIKPLNDDQANRSARYVPYYAP